SGKLEVGILVKEVDEYIEKQKSPQKEICKKLRKIILKAYPEITEEMKLGVPYYEGKFYIVGLKDHVNLGFSIMGLKEDEVKLFVGGGKTMKHLKFSTLKDIDEKKIVKLMKLVKKK
ncbi:TPA: DUF1801 domain-containing protein, partial [Candidatus Micrarchaeota archaeon]|nr:DUF1801 domain-containing protein [Candidatus Micrarchaeota archaeon]